MRAFSHAGRALAFHHSLTTWRGKMRAKELRVINEFDLENKIIELKKELMKINSQVAIGTVPKSPGKVKEMKRTIAKILTIKQKGGIKKE